MRQCSLPADLLYRFNELVDQAARRQAAEDAKALAQFDRAAAISGQQIKLSSKGI